MESMYQRLAEINRRPEPFEFYTADELWTNEYISQRMLEFHLNDDIDLASRNSAFVDRSVEWISRRFSVSNQTRIADFGCGPGLYTSRLAKLGAGVTGVDFSIRSVEYARNFANENALDIEYIHANYLDFNSNERFDLALLIYCDFCPLSPAQRKSLLSIFRNHIVPGGYLLLDVVSMEAFEKKRESAGYSPLLLDKFWSDKEYFGFLNSFKYSDERLMLDKYTIVEQDRTRVIYNWLQCFGIESLTDELEQAGFAVEDVYSDVAGTPYSKETDEFAVVAKRV